MTTRFPAVTPGPVEWTQAVERVVGLNHPTLTDVDNRPLRELLSLAGHDPDSAFLGLIGSTGMVNAASFFIAPITKEAAISAAIAYALANGKGAVWIPQSMLPYDASLVTFNANVRMIREGGDPTVFEAVAYGAPVDSITDALPAIQAAINAAQGNGVVVLPTVTCILNNATIPALLLPKNATNLVIRGAGRGSTTIVLSSNTPRMFDFNKSADGDTFQNITLEDFTVDSANIGGQHHVLLGTYQAGVTQTRINVTNITVQRVTLKNVLRDPNTAVNHRLGIWITVADSVAGGTLYSLTDMVFEDIRVEGGNYGIAVAASGIATTGLNILVDEIRLTNCYHDTGVTPTAFFTSANFQLGSRAKVGRIIIQNCQGFNAGDVGIEIDSFNEAIIEDCLIQDSLNVEYFSTNFNNFADPNVGQIAHFSRCHAKRVNCQFGRGMAFHENLSVALGRIVITDYTFENENASPIADASGAYYGLALESPTGTVVESISVFGMKIRDTGWTFTDANPQQKSLIRLNITGNVILRDIDVYVRGTQNVGSGTFTCRILSTESGTQQFLVDVAKFDVDITGINPFGTVVADLGSVSATLKGGIRRAQFIIGTDTSPRGISIRGVATLTLTAPFIIEECDFSGMAGASSIEVLFVTANENKDKVFFKNNLWRVFPKAISNITVGASPFTNQNLDGYAEVITVAGGTVSDISLSPDNVTFTSTGLTSGSFLLDNASAIKVTYTGLPTMKKIPSK